MWKLDQVSGSWEGGGRRGGERVLDLCTRCRMFAAEMHNRNTRQRNTGNLNSISEIKPGMISSTTWRSSLNTLG